MAKDPAVLFFIDKWLIATKEMKSDCRGWYLNLILHQFDKGDLPDELEELANLADVRISEYKKFEQVFEQVLKQKFDVLPNGRLSNSYAREILRKREEFKDKRTEAGKISYFLRYARTNLSKDENIIQFVKNKIDFKTFDVKNEQVFKQVFKQLSELYTENENVIVIEPNNTLNSIYDNSLWFLKFFHSDYANYVKSFNGQSTTEIYFLQWKEFVDFIYEKKYTDIFDTKFLNPHDFATLVTTKGFTKDKWNEVINKILATGVKPEHNLFFRIPQFMEYGKDKNDTQDPKTVKINI